MEKKKKQEGKKKKKKSRELKIEPSASPFSRGKRETGSTVALPRGLFLNNCVNKFRWNKSADSPSNSRIHSVNFQLVCVFSKI